MTISEKARDLGASTITKMTLLHSIVANVAAGNPSRDGESAGQYGGRMKALAYAILESLSQEDVVAGQSDGV